MTILILEFISYLHWETIFGCSIWYAYMPHILVVCIHLDIKSAAVSICLGLFLFLQFLCSSDIKFSTCHWILHDYRIRLHACKLLFSAVRLANLIMELPNPLRHHVILPVLLWRPFLVCLLPIEIPAHKIPAPRMIEYSLAPETVRHVHFLGIIMEGNAVFTVIWVDRIPRKAKNYWHHSRDELCMHMYLFLFLGFLVQLSKSS